MPKQETGDEMGERLQAAIDSASDQAEPLSPPTTTPAPPLPVDEQEEQDEREATTDIERLHIEQTDEELTNHLDTSVQFQDNETIRLEEVLNNIRARRSRYAELRTRIDLLDANAARRENEAITGLQAAHFARALMGAQRVLR